MTRITVHRTIDASIQTIFRAVSDIDNLPNTTPDIKHIEYLTDMHSGVGTRFRETREMKGKSVVTELEVTEYVQDERIRMVADSHGTVWDSVFTVEPVGERARLTIAMDARAHKLLPKLMHPLLKGLYRKGMQGHVDAVREYCERVDRSA